MDIEVAELALLVMLRKNIADINCEAVALSTETKAEDWREAKRRTLNRLEDQIAYKERQIKR